MTAAATSRRTKAWLDVEEPDLTNVITEDDTPVDSIFAEKQERLLTEPLYSSWAGPPAEVVGERRPFAALANVGLFASAEEDPIVPDMMLSLDVKMPDQLEQLREKKNRSYFIWKYGKGPEVVVEVVSNRVGEELGDKLKRYRRLRIPYYVVYDPEHFLGDKALRVFELRGDLYCTMDRPWFESVGLGVTVWHGTFQDMTASWLRWCLRDGELVSTGAELAVKAQADARVAQAEAQAAQAEAQAAQAEAQAAQAEAQAAQARAERLAARLRELGIDPDGEG